ncbi:MAG: hypothetical protein JJE28_08910 [Actinomycetales bacterium]|nr:hypothetical protein [Actinomycetales bacterium]
MTLRPLRSALFAGLVAALVATTLAACSPSIVGTQSLSGEAAKTAMLKVLDASLAKELETGITEQHTIGDEKFILVYDPTAPKGKQVAGMDATQSVAVYDTPDALSLNKMKAYVDSVGDSFGTVAYNGTSFTIDNSHFAIVLMVKDDIIEGSAITAGGSSTPQLVASTYSLSEIAKKILQGATTSTPAPTSTAAPAQ